MKECPTCHRSYRDDSLNFCLEDGSVLSTRNDPEATLVLPTPAIQNETSAPTPGRSNKLIYVVIALLALIAGGGLVALLKSNANETARGESQP
ncbi:MAG TPA: hypothetical protein VE863_06720, partial [Pyrinomonadaceae bacterium]|nr:hypothetical protein [Pyrinomonadaceae bacterium]